MKKFIPLLLVCLAIICFCSSCGMFEKNPVEGHYQLYEPEGMVGYICYWDPDWSTVVQVDRCDLYLYSDGKYTIHYVNSGSWEKSEDDPNKIILTASDSKVFSRMELAFDERWQELEMINTDTTNPDFEFSGVFKFYSSL